MLLLSDGNQGMKMDQRQILSPDGLPPTRLTVERATTIKKPPMRTLPRHAKRASGHCDWQAIESPSLSFPPHGKAARSEKASASGIGVHEGLPSGAGLGRREARRRGLGTAAVPNDKKAAEPLPVQPSGCFGTLTIENGNLGLWGDTNQTGFGLNADTHAKKRGELAGLFRHGHDGGTIADTDNATRLAVQSDDIASTETEWKRGFHLEL